MRTEDKRRYGFWGCLVIMMIVSGLAFVSCSDDESDDEPDVIWDIAPFDIDIMVMDESGENLLNPMVEGNWMDAPFQMLCQGEEYDANWVNFISPGNRNQPWKESRACAPAQLWGLRCVEHTYWDGHHWTWHENEYLLAFGEFESTENHDLKMEFYVPGRTDPYKISVEHRFGGYDLDSDEGYKRIWIDGKEVGSMPIKIVLPRRDDASSE